MVDALDSGRPDAYLANEVGLDDPAYEDLLRFAREAQAVRAVPLQTYARDVLSGGSGTVTNPNESIWDFCEEGGYVESPYLMDLLS